MKRKKSKGSGGRRPRRQRTQVQHYTDDIPGTFTKKKRRRTSDGSYDSGSSESESEEEEEEKEDLAVTTVPDRTATSTTTNIDNYATTTSTTVDLHEAGDVTMTAFAKAAKHKRKRPAKSSAVDDGASVTDTTTMDSRVHFTGGGGTGTGTGAGTRTGTGTGTNTAGIPTGKMKEKPPSPPPETVMLPHAGSVAPILPLATTCPLARHSLAQQYPVVYGDGLGIPKAPDPPTWKHVMANYEFYFPQDYKMVQVPSPVTGEDVLDPSLSITQADSRMAPVINETGPWPVCRFVTSVCTYGPYLAVGDSAGFVLLCTSTGPRGVSAIARLDTTASRREHSRQRHLQAKVEQQCRHKPELLEKRSAFWATAKTPNAIESMTWVGNLIVIMTSSEMEAIKLKTSAPAAPPSQSLGAYQNCEILWTMPVAAVAGVRKNVSNNTLLSGGEFVGSDLTLYFHHEDDDKKLLWNTWGVAPVVVSENGNAINTNSNNPTSSGDHFAHGRPEVETAPKVTCNWPLLLMQNVDNSSAIPSDFVKIVPFQREEEVEVALSAPVKRSPGRPPKKKPKPKVPVMNEELLWTEASKCHAAVWDSNLSCNEYRLIVAYSATASDAQIQLALLALTDDSSEQDDMRFSSPKTESGTMPSPLHSRRPQYAKLIKQTTISALGGPRNVANIPEVTIRQSPKGKYMLVSGSRGVRMFEMETMELLRVYGENVSLHGKAMVWKSCFVLDNHLQQQLYQQQEEQYKLKGDDDNSRKDSDGNLGTTLLRQDRQGFVWIELDNPLGTLLDDETKKALSASQCLETNNDIEDDDSTWLHQVWIVGIPHPFRGPKELQETLYFWQGLEKLPLFTMQLPQACGGVQSIYPIFSPSSQSNSTWQRLIVATVHGECFELAPTLKTNFAGNMYNPEYNVIDDNIEYIEDEDELDKVLVQVMEEDELEDAKEEVVAAFDFGSDVVDRELAEAIRLSLLESKSALKSRNDQPVGSATSDDVEDDPAVIVVKDSFDDKDDNEVVIPCEPEPFLRQQVMLDGSEAILDSGNLNTVDLSAKDAEFAREVMPLLPQSKFAQKRWEKQITRIEQHDGPLGRKTQFLLREPKQVVDSEDPSIQNAVAVKLGRGKRSKAGNLGALLESSIDPELRQYMVERDRLWVDGSGASLLDDAWGGSFAAASSSGDKNQSTAKNSANYDTEADRPTNGNSSSNKPHQQFSDGGSRAMKPLAVNMDADAAHDPGLQISVIELKDFTDVAQQYSCTNTIQIPLTLEECGTFYGQPSGTVVASSSNTERPLASKINFGCAACHGRMVIHSCGKRALPIDFEAIARAEKEKQDLEEAERKRLKIEKRKQAEIKRREAKKKKKEKERLERLVYEEKLCEMREAENAEARASMANIEESVRPPAGIVSGNTSSNGINQPASSAIHFSIADAWQEHAQKFSSSDNAGTSTPNAGGGAQSDALAALATMAEAASPQTGVSVLPAKPLDHRSEQRSDVVQVHEAASELSMANQASVAAEQNRVVHGFFSQEDAYPQHTLAPAQFQSPTSSVARIARTDKTVNSYHDAIMGEGLGLQATHAEAKPMGPQLRNDGKPLGFQIGRTPAANQVHQQRPFCISVPLPDAAIGERPYFGYTQLSSKSAKPKALGSQSSLVATRGVSLPRPPSFMPQRNGQYVTTPGSPPIVPSVEAGDNRPHEWPTAQPLPGQPNLTQKKA